MGLTMHRAPFALLALLAFGCAPLDKETAQATKAPQTGAQAVESSSPEYTGEASAAYMMARRYVQERIAASKTDDLAAWSLPESSSGAKIVQDEKDPHLYQVALKGKKGNLTRTWKVTLRNAGGVWKRLQVE